MKVELKPCLLCGKPGKVVREGTLTFSVRCDQPNHYIVVRGQSRAAAVTLWNTRSLIPGGEATDLSRRKVVNRVLGELLGAFVPEFEDRVRIGNHACTEILAALAALTPITPDGGDRMRLDQTSMTRLMAKFAQSADFTDARDCQIYDALQAMQKVAQP